MTRPSPLATPGVSGTFATTLSGGGGQQVTQGSPAGAASAWPVELAFLGALLALGQANKAGSLPVTLASDQGDLLANIDKIGGAALALGQAAKAASIPVALASDTDEIKAGLYQPGSTTANGFTTFQTDAMGGVAAHIFYVYNMLYNGASWDRKRTPTTFKSFSQAITSGTPVAVWTPALGKKFRLMGFAVTVSAAASVLFDDNSGATVLLQTPILAANSPFPSPPFGNGLASAVTNNVLKVDATVSATVSGFVFGTEE